MREHVGLFRHSGVYKQSGNFINSKKKTQSSRSINFSSTEIHFEALTIKILIVKVKRFIGDYRVVSVIAVLDAESAKISILH